MERRGRREGEKGRDEMTRKGIKGNVKMRERSRRAEEGGRVLEKGSDFDY